MRRRFHVPIVCTGELPLGDAEAHHLRDVLRLADGAVVEVFDDAGNTGSARVVRITPAEVVVRVEDVRSAEASFQWNIAAAIPKGGRVDWMIEKLAELGTARYIPLVTHRSVVAPEGRNKLARWKRIAEEASRQSRRAGVMRITEVTKLDEAIALAAGDGWYLSTSPEAVPAPAVIASAIEGRESKSGNPTHFIGPEGGWTAEEEQLLAASGLTGVWLGPNILRVETAAVATASLMAAIMVPQSRLENPKSKIPRSFPSQSRPIG